MQRYRNLLLLSLISVLGPLWAGEPLTYEADVRPILKKACFHCHGEAGEREGGLDLRLVRLMIAGGDSGAAIQPGSAADSYLWQQIESDEMPRGDKKLSTGEKDVIQRWLNQGAQTARPEPDDVAEARFTLEELDHWAFAPVVPPPIPQPEGDALENPIDAFIAEGLADAGFGFSERADQRTLLRRVSFDLIGLPLSTDEVDRFLEDPAPDAYARLVDRLLHSPQFGVRWGRHWLDVAGFAETDGGANSDPKRPHAWRYRDYVIHAFNQNKPIDQFLREQLAGDEMTSSQIDVHDRRQLELLTATGFLRMAPDRTSSENRLETRNQAVADVVSVVSSAVLGLSVGCAQCHDHKYDPIGIDDYYRFRAIFDPAFPLEQWQTPGGRWVDFTTEPVKAEASRIEAEAKALEDDLNRRRNELAKEIQELKLADVPEAVRDETRTAVLTSAAERNARQKELLDLYPMVKPVGNIIGLLVEYDMPAYRAFEKELNKIAAIRNTKPSYRRVMLTTERAGVVPTSHVFFRGNPQMPKEAVVPGELMVLLRSGREVEVPVNDAALETTGRRLAYARHVTDGQHPLTARVFVNRIWQHHMGRGLVATPNDFGHSGEAPTHPELLDWLAHDFIQHGWDAKRLHRMILLSRTYQQRSTRTAALDAEDPENRLWGRANLRRLDAEVLRDSLLAVSGRLNDRLGGSSIPVTQNGDGKAVIGVQKIRDGIPVGVDDNHADAFRRSIFVEVQRSLPLDVLATFDLPAMTPNCDTRQLTTVATQALWFLNDNLMLDRSDDLARAAESVSAELEPQIDWLYGALFGAGATAAEQAACREFVSGQAELYRNDPDAKWQKTLAQEPAAADRRALATLCQTLLASNRFLHVD